MKPTKEQIERCIEVYHLFVDKHITPVMLKKAREESGLQMFQVNQIIQDYINKTYNKKSQN